MDAGMDEGMDGEMDGDMDGDMEGDADAPVVGMDGEPAEEEEEKASNAGDKDYTKDPSKCRKMAQFADQALLDLLNLPPAVLFVLLL